MVFTDKDSVSAISLYFNPSKRCILNMACLLWGNFFNVRFITSSSSLYSNISSGVEGDFAAVVGDKVEAADVEVPAGEAHRAVAAGLGGGGLLVAAQDGAHAGDEFAGFEGFDEVVVGAQFEAQHAVGEAVAAGEDQRGAGVLFLEFAQHLQAVHVGQAEVEDGQFGLHPLGAGQQRPAGAEGFAAKAVFGEGADDQAGDVGFVFDDEDEGAVLVGGGHGAGDSGWSRVAMALARAARSKGLRRVGMSGAAAGASAVA